ncbi:MAG: cation:proton antiporter [Verrucomicrobium sp.]|nr:cation:proton antiporter [Verrucomicrobium sp.]
MESLLFIRDLAVVLLVAAAIGALFRKLGLSLVVGYLVAGLIIGPHTPPFSLVSDVHRIETLSQLGLVFLMFFVGLELSLRRIRRLGISLVLATGLTAFLVFHLTKILAASLGWGPTPGLVLASMLMVSSSAIITKTLSEAGLTHETFAQRALGMMILEDVVAVVMLTLITARVSAEGASANLGRVMGLLGGFVVLLIVVGLLVVPRFLRRLAKASDADLKVSVVAGVLMGAAFLAAWAGYSVALGAFLLGVVVAETPFRDRVERAFVGVQGMFAVIFFVSIGMLIDWHQLIAHAWLILGVSIFSILVRVGCATGAHILSGRTVTGAFRTALVVTPIGEFSYIIAQVGVSSHKVPDYFYSLAVGISAVTAFTAPILLRFSEPLAERFDQIQPSWVRHFLTIYRGWLEAASHSLKRNNFWILTRPRITQVTVEILLLVGVLGFSPLVRQTLGEMEQQAVWLDGNGDLINGAYWLVVFSVSLGLAVAIWRNLAAMSMILSETAFPDPGSRLRGVAEGAIQCGAAIGLIFLFWVAMPFPLSGWWSVAVLVASVALFLLFFWRRLIRWHSHFLYSFNNALSEKSGRQVIQPASVDESDWGVELVEITLPEGAPYAGQSLRELDLRNQFNCIVVEVERQGFEIPNPGPDVQLYPGDKLLLLGNDLSIGRTRSFLEQSSSPTDATRSFAENTLETIVVPEESRRLTQSLAQLRIFTETGVQVLGIRRGATTLLNPGGSEMLQPGDRLLILAPLAEIRRFGAWLLG